MHGIAGYNVISSNVDVGLSYAIVNTETEKEIWRSNAYAYSARVIDTSSIVSIIVSAVTVAVNTGTDYTKLSLVANQHGLSTLPVGKYHPNYKSDLEEVLVIPDSGEYKNGLLYVDEYFVYGENSEEDVPLVVRMRANGYFAFNVMSLGGNVFKHNGYTKYYYLEKVGEKHTSKTSFFFMMITDLFYLLKEKSYTLKENRTGKFRL
ncbi:MAG: DUF799 domain-containing protein [Geovibrio sp.]|nr:DUF799 domain-containing protein [Geovibrio sp.]